MQIFRGQRFRPGGSVSGSPVQWNIAGFAYFRNESLHFHWRDPKPDGEEPRNAIHLDKIGMEDFWRGYYEPVLNLIGSDRAFEAAISEAESIRTEEADLSIRVASPLMKCLVEKQWTEAGNWCLHHRDELTATKCAPIGSLWKRGNRGHYGKKTLVNE